jgi:hypothetical protein
MEALNGLQGTAVILTVLRYSLVGVPDTISVCVVRGSDMKREETPARMQGRRDEVALDSSLAQRTQEQSMHQILEQAQGKTSCADPTSAPLHAALLRAEAAEAELRTLKAQLAETDDTQQKHFAEWQKLDGFLQSLRKMGDKALRKEFNACSDVNKEAGTDARGEEHGNKEHNPLRISKQGLATFLAAKDVVLSEGQVDELMQRIDTDGDGQIDWQEFRTLVRSSSDLEMMFKAIPFERVLASCFPRGPANDPLGPFFRQQHSDVVAAVRKAGFAIVKMTMDVIEMQKKAEENQTTSGSGAKFGGELKGRSLEAFFEGVTGLTGEPHPELER